MTDWAQSGRIDRYLARLVDPITGAEFPNDIEIDGPKCSVTWAQDSDTFVSGVINLVNDTTYVNVNGIKKDCMVRLYHGIKVDDHDSLEHPFVVCTLFNQTSGTTSKFGVVDRKLNGYSAFLRYTKDVLCRDYSFLASQGYPVANFIKTIVEADGGKLVFENTMFQTDPSSGLIPAYWPFRQDVFFEVGRNKADVLNEVAGWISAEMGVLPDGSICIRRRIEPTQRPVRYVFESGRNCVYVPGITWKDTRADCYNRVIATMTENDATQTAIATLPDTSTGSFAMLGRYITKHVTSTKQDDGQYQDLSALAQSTLDEESAGQVFIEIESVSVPSVEVGHVVRYVNNIDWITDEGINALCEVVEKQSTFDIGCTTKWKLRVIG